jgi:dihydroneopterin aldolase
MSDRIVLQGMQLEGRHGVLAEEKLTPQPFEVDVELWLDLRGAGDSDDIARTIDYREVFAIARSVIEGPPKELIEALAESIASGILGSFAGRGLTEAVVRVHKPAAQLPGPLTDTYVEVRRSASAGRR